MRERNPDTAREDQAIAHGDPASLADIVETGGWEATEAGHYFLAEYQLHRAVRIRRSLEDRSGLLRVYRTLCVLYRQWGRLHRALDALAEADQHVRRDPLDAAGLAAVQADVAVTMTMAQRPDEAIAYMTLAMDAYRRLAPPAPAEQAYALMAWGHAVWATGRATDGRRRLSQALELAHPVDAELARQIGAGPSPGRPSTRVAPHHQAWSPPCHTHLHHRPTGTR
jgi:tetratricopeptide (TPR) repeat protein